MQSAGERTIRAEPILCARENSTMQPMRIHLFVALVVCSMVTTASAHAQCMWPLPLLLGWQQPNETQASQIQALHQRAVLLDRDNAQLQKQVAQSQQQVKLLRDQLALLQRRLTDTTQLLQEAEAARVKSEQQLQVLQVSTRHMGGATITANNSTARTLKAIEVPGLNIRQDDDVVRIEIQAEKIFPAGSAHVAPGALPLIDQVASVLSRNYPRQRIAIEGHSDNAVISTNPPIGGHQLAMAQAGALFEVLTQRNRLPAKQLFLVAHGANHPRASNGTAVGQAANRRLELVIYPETMDE